MVIGGSKRFLVVIGSSWWFLLVLEVHDCSLWFLVIPGGS